MTAARKSAFESLASKRALKEKDEEKKNIEEQITTPHPSPQSSPSHARVKKERKNVHLKNARQLLQRNYLHKFHLLSSRGYIFFREFFFFLKYNINILIIDGKEYSSFRQYFLEKKSGML